MPKVISRPAFLRANSCNFLATVIVPFFVFSNACSAAFEVAAFFLALMYSRLMRCFCNRFRNAFFCICGFSSKNFWYWKFTSFWNCFFSSFATFSRCFCSFPLTCLLTKPNNSSLFCSVLCAPSTAEFSFSVSAILPCTKFRLSFCTLRMADLDMPSCLKGFSLSTGTTTYFPFPVFSSKTLCKVYSLVFGSFALAFCTFFPAFCACFCFLCSFLLPVKSEPLSS
ncbi:hypothetical protein IMSAGC013_04573 [Lachnospiraceae bacterium]|nr:hypothetical protein IMSAGC013_04573 [Lachnospiraceae bacterium]